MCAGKWTPLVQKQNYQLFFSPHKCQGAKIIMLHSYYSIKSVWGKATKMQLEWDLADRMKSFLVTITLNVFHSRNRNRERALGRQARGRSFFWSVFKQTKIVDMRSQGKASHSGGMGP